MKSDNYKTHTCNSYEGGHDERKGQERVILIASWGLQPSFWFSPRIQHDHGSWRYQCDGPRHNWTWHQKAMWGNHCGVQTSPSPDVLFRRTVCGPRLLLLFASEENSGLSSCVFQFLNIYHSVYSRSKLKVLWDQYLYCFFFFQVPYPI